MDRNFVCTYLFSPFDPKVDPVIQLADFYPKDDGEKSSVPTEQRLKLRQQLSQSISGHIGVYVDVYDFVPLDIIGSKKLLREKLREILYEKCLRLNMTVLKSFFNTHKIFDGIIVKSVMPGVVFDCVCTTLESLRHIK